MNRSARVRAARLPAVLALALAASGWAAGSSDAAGSLASTVTLGSPLTTAPFESARCGLAEAAGGCLGVTNVLPGRDLVAPFSGVIVRWHARLGPETEAQTIRIRVLQRVAPEEFKIVSSGPPQAIPAGAGMYTFSAALPIAAGDEVGLEASWFKSIEFRASSPGAYMLIFNPIPGLDGSETGAPVFPDSSSETTFNVEMEPDCDHDGLGDDTQDPNISSCLPPPPSIPTGLPEAPKTCVVPNLKGKTLKAAKNRARKAHCRIGSVKLREGVSKKTGKVVKQKPKAGKVKAAGKMIAVTLG